VISLASQSVPPSLSASPPPLTPSLPPRLLASCLSSDAGETSGGGGDIKPDLVRQYLSSEQHSASQRNREALAAARESFATHAHDVGGTEVQIAALTERIRYMTDHLRTHRKDKASRLGLVAMLERRKKLLKYLRRSDGDSYGEVIYRLGLKDRSFVEDKYLKK